MGISTEDDFTAVGGPTAAQAGTPSYGPVIVRPSDHRYSELVTGRNRRWTAAPDSVHLVGTTDQARHAVQEAIRTGKRVSIRSGGHCYADFVYNPAVDLIIDLSLMNRIYYDPERAAFAVESGAQLGHIYETLFRGWDVTIPGGVCPTVGIGGHASGGGHGLLSRQFGNVADHIEAVEIVVNRHGSAEVVVASRDDSGAENDLWWASSGGGGGNFGVITRYWFRSWEATGPEPGQYLPRPPKEVLVSSMFVPWNGLDQTKFSHLIRNLGAWYERHSGIDSPFTPLCGLMFVQHVSSGGIGLLTQIDAAVPDAARLLDEYLSAVTTDTGVTGPFPYQQIPWMTSVETIFSGNQTVMTAVTPRNAVKSAYFRRNLTDDQIAAIYRNMTRTDYSNPGAVLQLGAMAGGQMNALSSTATAIVQRSSVFLAFFQNSWADPAEDDIHLGWLRDIYGETFADTGGYPVPGERYEGCSTNAPDLDITNPEFNRSGVPWHTFYYGENYARLQRAKAHWDPTNFFRHSLSITAP